MTGTKKRDEEEARRRETAPPAPTSAHSAHSANLAATPERIQMAGPDGGVHWYISTAMAVERIGKHRRRIQDACNDYWQRISKEAAEGRAVDYTPTPHELACVKLGTGLRALTWVREDTIPLHFINRVGEDGTRPRGRVAGWKPVQPYHYRPKSQDRRFKQTRDRLARQASQAEQKGQQGETA